MNKKFLKFSGQFGRQTVLKSQGLRCIHYIYTQSSRFVRFFVKIIWRVSSIWFVFHVISNSFLLLDPFSASHLHPSFPVSLILFPCIFFFLLLLLLLLLLLFTSFLFSYPYLIIFSPLKVHIIYFMHYTSLFIHIQL